MNGAKQLAGLLCGLLLAGCATATTNIGPERLALTQADDVGASSADQRALLTSSDLPQLNTESASEAGDEDLPFWDENARGALIDVAEAIWQLNEAKQGLDQASIETRVPAREKLVFHHSFRQYRISVANNSRMNYIHGSLCKGLKCTIEIREFDEGSIDWSKPSEERFPDKSSIGLNQFFQSFIANGYVDITDEVNKTFPLTHGHLPSHDKYKSYFNIELNSIIFMIYRSYDPDSDDSLFKVRRIEIFNAI